MLGLLSRKKKSNEIININPKLLEREGIRKFDNNKFIRNFKFGIDKYNISILPEKKKTWIDNLNIKKIFLINLENQPEKLLLMKFKLAKINFTEYQIIKAINGYEERKSQEYFEKLKNNSQNKINSLGALGLLKTYQEFLNTNLNLTVQDRILILEDDICFHQDFNNLIENFNLNDNYDIIYLGFNLQNWDENLKIEFLNKKIIDFTFFNRNIYGTYGIILNYKTIELLKKKLNEPLIYPIDVLLNNLRKEFNLKTIGINPALIIPIVSTSINMGKRNQLSFLNNIKQDYRNYQFFNLSMEFYQIYTNYFSYQLNLRNNHPHLINDINNLELAKLIEDKNKFFCIIITSYNNEEWVKLNLDSVINQTYPHWRILYYNDNSNDKTLEKVQNYIRENSLENKINIINSKIRNYQGYGRWLSYQQCDDDEICVFLDGDDWLADNFVLQKLNHLYLEKNYMVTYGGYNVFYKNKITKIKTEEFPLDIIQKKAYRKYQWISFHLRTGIAKLFKSIPLEHLQDKNGEYIKCVTDWAEMFWVLERCEGRHGINPFDSYIYNKDASIMNENSFYNRDKDEAWKIYRQELEDKYRNFTI